MQTNEYFCTDCNACIHDCIHNSVVQQPAAAAAAAASGMISAGAVQMMDTEGTGADS